MTLAVTPGRPRAPRVPGSDIAGSRPRGRPEPEWAGAVARSRARPDTPTLQPPSLLVGAALAAVVSIEVYLGVANVALAGGQLLFALGIVLDGCSRALGTLAAIKVGRLDWGWVCLLLGSPAVAAFTLFRHSGAVTVEPGPLAGLLSLLALALVALALLVSLLGI